MVRGHRILLTFLLALLLPLQGLAATTMLLCGPAHHAPASAATPGHHAAAHDAGAATHEHHAGTQPSGGQCSACAACCMSTAIIPATLALPMLPVMAVYAMRSFAVPVAVVTSGLERPPRSNLA